MNDATRNAILDLVHDALVDYHETVQPNVNPSKLAAYWADEWGCRCEDFRLSLVCTVAPDEVSVTAIDDVPDDLGDPEVRRLLTGPNVTQADEDEALRLLEHTLQAKRAARALDQTHSDVTSSWTSEPALWVVVVVAAAVAFAAGFIL